MIFDTVIDRRGTNCEKWDANPKNFGVPVDTGLGMGVADMDFAAPACVTTALQDFVSFGVFGYKHTDDFYREAICTWMANRHGWSFDPAAIFSVNGLCNGVGLCLEAYTNPGDGIVLFTPVYHAFARVITAAGRKVVEMPLALNDGRYEMDFDAYDAQMTGKERMLILCSPHNPGGRVWTKSELTALVDFATRHDLLIISDEIHLDLAFPGQIHVPTATIPGARERLIVLSAASKAFNLAAAYTGQAIIEDGVLRARFTKLQKALVVSPNTFGLIATAAAYSDEGAKWLEDLKAYLAENARTFDAALNSIPGVNSMQLESTFLSWVDFSGTGMPQEEFIDRVSKTAQIGANRGFTFGSGGESFMRFNIGTSRATVQEAANRLKAAFADLQ